MNTYFKNIKKIGALILTILIHTAITPFELSWSYSIWLESLAILP